MASSDILVLGSGSLATAVCSSFAMLSPVGSTVTVASRTPSTAAAACYVAAGHASMSGTPVSFRPAVVPVYSAVAISALIRRTKPGIVLNCTSYQSPWESVQSPSAWTELIGRAGFGITLPLQAGVAVEVGRAMAHCGSDALLINASYPDAVNPLLRSLGLPIFCGIGNVALLGTSVRAAMGLGVEDHVQVLGHHRHLEVPQDVVEEALVWVEGEQVDGVGDLLSTQRSIERAELNKLHGHAAARLLTDLLCRRETRVSLPGPLGLNGGYPVRIKGTGLALDLPAGMTPTAAAERNARWARQDGVLVSDTGEVTFSAAGLSEVAAELPEIREPLRAEDIAALRLRLMALRSRLRGIARDQHSTL